MVKDAPRTRTSQCQTTRRQKSRKTAVMKMATARPTVGGARSGQWWEITSYE